MSASRRSNSVWKQLTLVSRCCCDNYFHLALAANIFFGDSNAHGVFPQEAIFRFQKSSRNCSFLPAACVWNTPQCQVDLKDDEEAAKPLDVAQIVRRYVIKDDISLENRVINNEGGFAATLASQITGRKRGVAHWKVFDFEEAEDTLDQTSRDQEARDDCLGIHKRVGAGRFGIIRSFRVKPKFQEAAKKEAKIPA
jgi:hypothetical protein